MRAFEERFENLSDEDHRVVNLAFNEIGCYLCDLMAIGGETELHPDILSVLLVSVSRWINASEDAWQGYLTNNAPGHVARLRADVATPTDRSKLN